MTTSTLAAAAFAAIMATTGAAFADPGPRSDRHDWRVGHVSEHRYGRDGDYRRGWGDAYDRQWDFSRRMNWIDTRIERGFERGDLTWREARNLSHDLRRIADLRALYARNGISRHEAVELDNRLDRLSERVRFERRDNDARYRYRDWRGYR